MSRHRPIEWELQCAFVSHKRRHQQSAITITLLLRATIIPDECRNRQLRKVHAPGIDRVREDRAFHLHFVHLRGARDDDGGVGVRLRREEDVEVVVLSAPGVAREFQQVKAFQCLNRTKIA